MWEMDGAFRVGTPKKTKKGMNEKIRKSMEPGWGSRGVVHCFRAVSEKKKREERQETGINSVFHTHTHTYA